MKMSSQAAVLFAVATGVSMVSSCSSQSEDVPAAHQEITENLKSETKDAVQEKLTSLFEATAAVSKVENVIHRGLTEKSTQEPSSKVVAATPVNLIEPSSGDQLMFDQDRPNQFRYELSCLSRSC
jgi:hypothetical protein